MGLFAADPALSRRLNEYCDQVLLGKVTSSMQENPSYPGLQSLTMTIDVKIISTSTGDVQQIQASAVGAGYSLEKPEAMRRKGWQPVCAPNCKARSSKNQPSRAYRQR